MMIGQEFLHTLVLLAIREGGGKGSSFLWYDVMNCGQMPVLDDLWDMCLCGFPATNDGKLVHGSKIVSIKQKPCTKMQGFRL